MNRYHYNITSRLILLHYYIKYFTLFFYLFFLYFPFFASTFSFPKENTPSMKRSFYLNLALDDVNWICSGQLKSLNSDIDGILLRDSFSTPTWIINPYFSNIAIRSVI